MQVTSTVSISRRLLTQTGAEVVAVGIVIKKSFQQGGKLLEEAAYTL